jgi:hypothetical protein
MSYEPAEPVVYAACPRQLQVVQPGRFAGYAARASFRAGAWVSSLADVPALGECHGYAVPSSVCDSSITASIDR